MEKLVIQHRVLKAVEVLVSQGNERGGEFLIESSRVFFREKFMFIQSLPQKWACENI